MGIINGSFPVDCFEITEEAGEYLKSRGALVASSDLYQGKPYIQFPDCKPSHLGDSHNNHIRDIRVFFPNEDEILMFSVAFGYLIQNTRVKSLRDMILKERFGIQEP